MRFIKIGSSLLHLVLAVIFGFSSFAIAVILSYILGGSVILDNPVVVGSDNTFHLAWIYRLKEYYPQIPLWFPYAGGGSSLVIGYWMIPHYMVIFFSSITTLTVEQWLRIIEFITVPIVTFELYLFAALRLKNYVVGVIAAFLYPLSSVAYGWIAHAGFFSMHTSLIMVIPAITFYDGYLSYVLEGSLNKGRGRFYLLLAGIFIALSLLTHLGSGATLLLGLPLYTLVLTLFKLPKGGFKVLLRGVRAFITAVIVGVGISAFLFLPQKEYFDFQAQDFTPYFAPKDYPQLPYKQFLGFERLTNIGSLYTPLFMSRMVAILALVGIGFGLLGRNKMGALGIVALFYIFWMSNTRYLAGNFSFLNPLLLPTNIRSVGVTAAYLTLLAAFGIWSISDVLGMGLRFLSKRIKLLHLFLKPITLVFASVVAVYLTVQLFYLTRTFAEYEQIVDSGGDTVEGYKGYGPLGIPSYLCWIPGWENVGVSSEYKCPKRPESLKDIVISTGGRDPLPEMDFDNKMESLGVVEGKKVAISSHLGTIIAAFSGRSKAYMLNSPSGQTVLNLSFLGIQDQAFYQKGNTSENEVAEIAKWFGLEYVFMHGGDDKDALYRFDNSSWDHVDTLGGIIEVYKFNSSPTIAQISNKPGVLVIGSVDKRAYEAIFRSSVKGAVPFDKAVLVKGGEYVDNYSLDDLKKFKVVVLHGYSYHNRGKAWNMLRKYVEEGGSLFIDTGWQYVSKDWSTDKGGGSSPVYTANLENPFPVIKTTWGLVDEKLSTFTLDKDMAKGVSKKEFGELAWEDDPWSVAFATKGDVAPWATPVLYKGDEVIIAKGELGEGKVVWSGMNIFAHAYDKKNDAEFKLISNLFNYLLPETKSQIVKVDHLNSYPDRVEIIPKGNVSQNSFLYYAQTYTPQWRAYLVSYGKRERLEVFPSGPSQMAVFIPSMGKEDKIVMEYDLSSKLLLARIITISILIILFISILDGTVLKSTIENTIKNSFSMLKTKAGGFSKRKITEIAKEEDEDY